MGFWSGLGKVLGVAAPFIAAPFTGGASLAAAPSLLSKIGSAAAGAAAAGFGPLIGGQRNHHVLYAGA